MRKILLLASSARSRKKKTLPGVAVKPRTIKKQSFLLPLFCFTISMSATADHISPEVNRALLSTKQNVLLFLKKEQGLYRVKPRYEKKLKKNYLLHYYAPWNNRSLTLGEKETLNLQKRNVEHYLQHPGYNENRYPHTKAWIESLVNQMQLNHFPNRPHKAMTINSAKLRLFPTIVPSFESRKLAGQGFPFDNFQTSMLSANLPVYVLQVTKNRAWQLILTPFMSCGWVQTKNIAPVNKRFIKKWMVKNYLVSVRRHTSVGDKQHFFFLSTLGELYPLLQENTKGANVLVAIKNSQGEAQIKRAQIPRNTTKHWPIAATPHNIAQFANQFMGMPYGWGDLYGYLDCSSEIKNLFAAFAIWLPRNSSAQAKIGKQISLTGLGATQKRNRIIESAIPFFTLVHAPGHIMLYIGTKNNHAYVFHNKWGLHTQNPETHHPGRNVIGRTVIMPLDLGKNIPKLITVLQRVIGMNYLLPKRYLEKMPK